MLILQLGRWARKKQIGEQRCVQRIDEDGGKGVKGAQAPWTCCSAGRRAPGTSAVGLPLNRFESQALQEGALIAKESVRAVTQLRYSRFFCFHPIDFWRPMLGCTKALIFGYLFYFPAKEW